MSGSANGQVLDHYLSTQFEVIRVVHDNLDSIRAVASHLTPVEDLVDFREEVEALYAKLGTLTTASELILSATPSGIAVLTAANAAAQRLLLELKSAALHEAEYFATAAGLVAAETAIAVLGEQVDALLLDLATKADSTDLTALAAQVNALDAQFTAIDTNLAAHESRIDALEGQVDGVIATNVSVDSRLTSITDLVTGQGSAINGLTSRVQSNEDGAVLTVQRVTVLETEMVDLDTGLTAQTTALQNLTSLTSIMDGTVTSQGELLTELSSRLADEESATTAAALATQNLTTTVTQHGALIAANTESTTQLASRVTDTETGVINNASALSSLETEVTLLGDSITVVSEDVTALTAAVGSPGNLAPNAGFEGDTHGWTIFNRGAGWATAQLGRDLDAVTALPLSMHALSVTVATQPSGLLGIKSDNLPTRGGQRYLLSGWLATLNCTATLEWRLLDQAGQIIQLGSIGSARNGGTTDINQWPRLWGAIPANTDARELQIQVWIQTVTGPGPKLWLLRPMLEEVSGLQDGPSAWVPGVTGLALSTASAVNTLTARLDGVEGDLTATASEVTELNTDVDTMQSALINEIITSSNKNAATAASLNTLTSRMADVETNSNAATTAVDTLTTRVTNVEGTVTSHGSSLTSLQAQVNSMDQDTGGQGAAISALDTRVTSAEGTLTSHGNSITSLQNSVTNANKTTVSETAPATSGRNENDLWIQGSTGKIYTLTSGAWVHRPNQKNRVFAQDAQPTAENIGDFWLQTNAGNKPWRWNGTTWIDVTDTRITSNASAITTLTTRVTAVEGVNTSQGSAITALENTVNNGSTGVVATANALSTLTTRVTNTETTNTSQANSLTSLTTRITDAEGVNSSQASAITSLTTRVTSAEGVNTSQASSITSLNSTVAGKADVTAVTALTTRVTDTEQAGGGTNLLINSSFNSDLKKWIGEGATSSTMIRDQHGFYWQPAGMHALVLAPNNTPGVVGGVGATGGSYYYVYQTVSVEPGKKYCASAYFAAHRGHCFVYLVWKDNAGGIVSTSITPNTVVGSGGSNLAVDYTRLHLAASAPAGATQVSVAFGWRKSLNDPDGAAPYLWLIRPMFEQIPAAQTVPSPYNPGGLEMMASYTLSLDVNGYVTGWNFSNDGTTGVFDVRADRFSVTNPSGGPSLTWNNGTLWNRGDTYSVLIGNNMGTSSNLLMWAGPNPTSAATINPLNGCFSVDNAGNARFSGLIEAGLIRASAFELNSTRIHTGGGRLAPFTVRDFGYEGAANATAARTVTLSGFVPPTSGSGYHHKRFSRAVADVVLTCHFHGNGANGENLYVEVDYDNSGNWTVLQSVVGIEVDYRGGFTIVLRYTTRASWSTVAFRARTTLGRAICLSLDASIDNTYETGNAPETNSGMGAGSGAGGAPPPPPDPGDEYCVDYATTVLPDGRYVRDLQIGDLVETVTVATGERSLQPLLAMDVGEAYCYLVHTEHGAVIQSESTPMDMRDGSILRTPDLAGQALLTHAHDWETATVFPLGMRKVCRPNFGDRMFFAGIAADRTLATHNFPTKVLQ